MCSCVNCRRPPGGDPLQRMVVRRSVQGEGRRPPDWLAGKGLTPVGAPTFAYYNDPFTPGFLRRNEILYDLGP